MDLDTMKQVGAVAFIGLIVAYNLYQFVKNRRCPGCRKWFVGKKGKAWASDSNSQTGKFWDFKTSSYSRETRSSATVHTPFQCKECGRRWSVTSRTSRVVEH